MTLHSPIHGKNMHTHIHTYMHCFITWSSAPCTHVQLCLTLTHENTGSLARLTVYRITGIGKACEYINTCLVAAPPTPDLSSCYC